MGLFDAITIDYNGMSVTLQRPEGPLEEGYFGEGGVWVPSQRSPQNLRADGFGVDSNHNPYFQPGGADIGERADLFIDPVSQALWLEVT